MKSDQILKQISSIASLKEWRLNVISGVRIAFVPTMGCLHEGHFSLIRQAKSLADIIVVSIFVNPIQFTDANDYATYPNHLRQDQDTLENLGVDILFTPTIEEVFPTQAKERIQLSYPNLMQKMCGAMRTGHFEGVLYIVYKLLSWVQPDLAIFGLKDYQQYLCILKMIEDLEIQTEVIGSALIRETSGLALSSRNVRLSTDGRELAKTISKTLFFIEELFQTETDIPYVIYKEKMFQMLSGLEHIEYAGIYNSETLDELQESEKVSCGSLVAIVAFVEDVRLIDNLMLIKLKEINR